MGVNRFRFGPSCLNPVELYTNDKEMSRDTLRLLEQKAAVPSTTRVHFIARTI